MKKPKHKTPGYKGKKQQQKQNEENHEIERAKQIALILACKRTWTLDARIAHWAWQGLSTIVERTKDSYTTSVTELQNESYEIGKENSREKPSTKERLMLLVVMDMCT